MGTNKEDTDPSSPSALRPRTSGYGPVAEVDFGSGKPTTDPGLGPPSDPPPAPSDPPPPVQYSGRSQRVIVPPPSDPPPALAITPPEFRPIPRSPSLPSLNKDSVELLLEGMTGPRPDRRKTTPQSDGEASASYHAEHGVRPARSSSADLGPKVVVERPTGPPSSRRQVSRQVTTDERALPGSRDSLSTFVPGRVLRRRVAFAILAGVLIVFTLFAVFRASKERTARAPAPTPPETAGTAAAPTPPETAAATGAATETNAAPPATPLVGTTTAPVPAVESAPTAVEAAHVPAAMRPTDDSRPTAPAHASGTVSTHHRRTVVAEPAPSGDLGEFKSKF